MGNVRNIPAFRLSVLLAVIAFLVYANTLSNGFALDDYLVISRNSIVTQGLSAIPELLSTPYHKGNSVMSNDLYRPLSLVTFAVEYQLFGDSPFPGHLINVLLFTVSVVLLFRFLIALFGVHKTVAAFIAALLFALHPIHTEVVANIKSRDELLCFVLSFSALLAFIRYFDTGKILKAVTGAGLLLLGLLAKETAISFVAVVPLIFLFKSTEKRRGLMLSVVTLATALVYLAIRFSVLKANNADHISDVTFIDNMLSAAPSTAQKFATAIAVLGNYIRLVFVPYPLLCDYSYSTIPFVNFKDPAFVLSAMAYVALIVLTIYRMFTKGRDLLAFGILFFLLTIALFSNIPFLVGALMAERFAFFASVGFCIAVAWVIDKWLSGSKVNGIESLRSVKALAVLAPLCLVYASLTFARNSDWKNNSTLYRTDITKAPGNSRMHYYLGTDMLISATEGGGKEGVSGAELVADGVTHLKRAAAIYPGFWIAYAEIGTAYLNTKSYDSAAVYFEKALAGNSSDTMSMHNLAAVYFYQQKFDQSIAQCRAAIALDPGYSRGYRNMGSGYMKLGKYDSAIVVLREAIAIDPAANGSYQNIALSFKLLGNMDSARKYEAIARQRNPAFSLDASGGQQ